MFYFNFENIVKKIEISVNGRQKLSATAKNKFHYMSRTDHFEAHHQHVAETIEFVKSGHLPSFAENNPEVFGKLLTLMSGKMAESVQVLWLLYPKNALLNNELNWQNSLFWNLQIASF